MCSEHIEGDEWGTYVALGRSTPAERGMAYGARALGPRSANSTRGSHVLSRGTGEPCTGGSGTGGWRAIDVQVGFWQSRRPVGVPNLFPCSSAQRALIPCRDAWQNMPTLSRPRP